VFCIGTESLGAVEPSQLPEVERLIASTINLDTFSMTDFIRLQDWISHELCQRYRRHVALAFTDIVDSTAYLTRFGDVAGQALQQRYLDLVQESVTYREGRILDTAGDGCFMCFPQVEQAVQALSDLQRAVAAQNAVRFWDDRLAIRCGIHWGEVLTDGLTVKGYAVNLCARLCSSVPAGQVWMTRDAYLKLSNVSRLRCEHGSAIHAKGLSDCVEVFKLDWRLGNDRRDVYCSTVDATDSMTPAHT